MATAITARLYYEFAAPHLMAVDQLVLTTWGVAINE